MKWIGVSGSWRKTCPELQHDLQREVTAVLQRGDGIITGGALGVDYLATNLALQQAPDGSQLKVFLPTSLEIYAAHYQQRASEGVITQATAKDLIQQLLIVNSIGSLVVNLAETILNERTYYQRNTRVINASDELLAFQVNSSAGTQDTIDKARAHGVSVALFRYTVD
ncbi:MAG: hypothetical protein ABI602_04715 [Candidatus Saccharibacteria bacterium]